MSAILAWGALEDLRRRIIPHAVVFAAAGLWLVYIVLGHGSLQGGLIAGAVLLGLGFLLFQFNLMGGGDVKLMAAIGLWTGLSHLVHFVFYTTIAGGFVALAVLVAHRMRPQVADGEEQAVPTVPYGLAIAFGGTVAVWQAALMEAL